MIIVAVRALKLTISLYVEKGRFRQAADRESEAIIPPRSNSSTYLYVLVFTEDIAQIYQQDGGDMNAALEAYEQAGDWYTGEDASA